MIKLVKLTAEAENITVVAPIWNACRYGKSFPLWKDLICKPEKEKSKGSTKKNKLTYRDFQRFRIKSRGCHWATWRYHRGWAWLPSTTMQLSGIHLWYNCLLHLKCHQASFEFPNFMISFYIDILESWDAEEKLVVPWTCEKNKYLVG